MYKQEKEYGPKDGRMRQMTGMCDTALRPQDQVRIVHDQDLESWVVERKNSSTWSYSPELTMDFEFLGFEDFQWSVKMSGAVLKYPADLLETDMWQSH